MSIRRPAAESSSSSSSSSALAERESTGNRRVDALLCFDERQLAKALRYVRNTPPIGCGVCERSVAKLVVALDHDRCGALICKIDPPNAAVSGLIDAIGTLATLKSATAIVLCSFSNRQSDHINALIDGESSKEVLGALPACFKRHGLASVTVDVDNAYFAEVEYERLKTKQDLTAHEALNQKAVLVDNILNAFPDANCLFLDDKFELLPSKHPQARKRVHWMQFSPMIWPLATTLDADQKQW